MVTGQTVLRTAADATTLRDALVTSGEFTIEAWIIPGSSEPPGTGPARIVGMSSDQTTANFSLSQGRSDTGSPGDNYSLRLRSTDATVDPDGLPGFDTPVESAQLVMTHLVATRGPGASQVTLYIDGNLVTAAFREGTFANWIEAPVSLGNHGGPLVEPSDHRSFIGTYFLVAIYDRALSIGEIQSNFGAGP